MQRDHAVETLYEGVGDFGSGYPSDPKNPVHAVVVP
jgi:ribonuclease HII